MGIYSDFVHELTDHIVLAIRNNERMVLTWRRMQIIDQQEFDEFHKIVCDLEGMITEYLEKL